MEYKQITKTKASAEKGGGEKLVQIPQCRTIDNMVKRLIASGELAKVNESKFNTHGTKKQAEKMLEAAKPVPIYMSEAEIFKESQKAEKCLEKIQKISEEDLENQQIKELEKKYGGKKRKEYKKFLEEKVASDIIGD